MSKPLGIHPPFEAEQIIIPFLRAQGVDFRGKAVLDIGTGSGILAIHAAKEGASRVVATEIDPKAAACAKKNAAAAGVGSLIKTLLAPADNPGAFAPIKALEKFDIVLSNPPYQLSNIVHQAGRREPLSLGLSIIGGLKARLNPGGAAALLYGSAYLHEFMTRYARHLGFQVRHDPPTHVLAEEWACLYNFYTWHVARKENIDPRGVMVPAGNEIRQPPFRARRGEKTFPGIIFIQN